MTRRGTASRISESVSDASRGHRRRWPLAMVCRQRSEVGTVWRCGDIGERTVRNFLGGGLDRMSCRVSIAGCGLALRMAEELAE